MESVFTLVHQTVLMFLFAMIGFLLFKKNKISLEGSKSIGNILIFVILPSVIIKGFLVERSPEKLAALAIATVCALIVLLLSIGVSHLLFRKDAIASFASAFSNPGFFGVPLIMAAISEDAVFYIASFIGILNLMQWTYGVSIMTGQKGKITGKQLVKAPFLIAIVIGIIFFIMQIQLPAIVTSFVGGLCNLNTPLAMFTVGVYFAQTDIKKMLINRQNYFICFSRLLLIPVISMGVLLLIPQQFMDLKLAILIAISCPVGSNVAVYAQLHKQDYAYAVETVVMSTLFSIATIPLIQTIGMTLFQKICI